MSLLEKPTRLRRPAPAVRPEAPHTAPDDLERASFERGAWSLVWLGVLTGGIDLWGFWWSSPVIVALAALTVVAGLVGIAVAWLVARPGAGWFGRTAFGAVLVAVTAPEAVIIHTRHFYTTDSAAFDDVAVRALAHGHNPYTVSMASAARLLDVPDRYWTYTVSGSHVAHASYPAGSFLFDMPAWFFGMHHQLVDWVDLGAWLVTGILLFVLLPRTLTWLAALVTLTPMFVGMFSTGGTDALFLPFLVLALWRWDHFGRGAGAGVAGWIGPVALGAACSIKQLPWFCVPFLAVGVFLEARRRGSGRGLPLAARYLAVTAATFTLVNLPFIAWSPGPWLHGTLTPLVDPLVADGQGLVTLATHGLTGGVDLTMLTAAGALAALGLLVAFAGWYEVLKRVWPFLLPVVFFFSSRSLASYLVDIFPAAIVAAATVEQPALATTSRRAGAGRRRLEALRSPGPGSDAGGGLRPARRLPGLVVALVASAVVATSVVAFTRHPLQIGVRAVHTSHRGRAVESLTLMVGNDTDRNVTPHFLVNMGANPNGFWAAPNGRAVVLSPHTTRIVTLVAPPQTVAPQSGARWLVEAYTASPRTLSTSPLELWHGRNG